MSKKPDYQKTYYEKLGRIKWEWNPKTQRLESRMVEMGNSCLYNMNCTVLTFLRDALRTHAEGITGCPWQYANEYGGVEEGCEAWSKEIKEAADLCDYCLHDEWQISEDEGISPQEAIKKRKEKLAKFFKWLTENLDAMWY